MAVTIDKILKKPLMHKHSAGDIINPTGGYVTIDTKQTITGEKTINNDFILKAGRKLILDGQEDYGQTNGV